MLQQLRSLVLPWGVLLHSVELVSACTKAARVLPGMLEPLGILCAGWRHVLDVALLKAIKGKKVQRLSFKINPDLTGAYP